MCNTGTGKLMAQLIDGNNSNFNDNLKKHARMLCVCMYVCRGALRCGPATVFANSVGPSVQLIA
jgi:hypothetical protein